MEEGRSCFPRIVGGLVLIQMGSNLALESRLFRGSVWRGPKIGGLEDLGVCLCGGRLGDLSAAFVSRPHDCSISFSAARSPERNAPSM